MGRHLVIDGPLADQRVESTYEQFSYRYYPDGIKCRWDPIDEETIAYQIEETVVYHRFKVALVDGPYADFEFVYATGRAAVDEWCWQLTKRMCRGWI